MYWSALPRMIVPAHRELDRAVIAVLRAFTSAFRSPPATGRAIAARSARRSEPSRAATSSSTSSSVLLVRSRVVTAAPADAAPGFTPRHSRSLVSVMRAPELTILNL